MRKRKLSINNKNDEYNEYNENEACILVPYNNLESKHKCPSPNPSISETAAGFTALNTWKGTEITGIWISRSVKRNSWEKENLEFVAVGDQEEKEMETNKGSL